jgi:hypothetical protein
MQAHQRAKARNVAGVYASAFWITTLLHEAAHAIVGRLLGRGPVLHTTFVEYARDGAVSAQVATALAGPFFSAGSGLALLAWLRSERVPAPLRPLVTWLAYHGLVNFVGYLFSVAFAPGGDLGRAAALLGMPTWLSITITITGFALLRVVARPFGPVLAVSATVPLPDEAAARAYARGILVGAWLATPLLVLASLPAPHWITLLYTLAAPFPLFELSDALALERARAHGGTAASSHAWPYVLLFAVLVVASRLLLDGGWTLG